jgi:hypothetical protein
VAIPGEVRLPAAGHWLVLLEDERKTWRLMGNVILPANGETLIGAPAPVQGRSPPTFATESINQKEAISWKPGNC